MEERAVSVMAPFVKWAGGKRQLLEPLRSRMPQNYGRYYEPFIGGGALLFSVQPKNAVISDTNAQLTGAYRQIRDNSEGVIAQISLLDSEKCSREKFLETRERYNLKIRENITDCESAALFIWINKHCFNGIYRVNAKGLFNVPYNNREEGASIDADNIRRISRYLNGDSVDIRNCDFEEGCSDVREGDFVYFDSPYIPISETADFTSYTKDGFGRGDQERLAELCRKLTKMGVMVMLSNNDVPDIYRLYEGFDIETVSAKRSVNRNAAKRKGQEVIITNYRKTSEGIKMCA